MYFVVNHLDLGEFSDELAATAAAWSITPPGSERPRVFPVYTPLPQVCLEPDESMRVHQSDPAFWRADGFVRDKLVDDRHAVAHTIEHLYASKLEVATHCGKFFLVSDVASAVQSRKHCRTCTDRRQDVSVRSARVRNENRLSQGVHIVERSHHLDGWLRVQMHCGQITTASELARVMDTALPHTAQCYACWYVDPDVGCPRPPINWS